MRSCIPVMTHDSHHSGPSKFWKLSETYRFPYDVSHFTDSETHILTFNHQVASAIEQLVQEHQRVPGNILLALTERVYEMPKSKTKPTEPVANGKCHNGTNGISDKCDSDKAKVS